MKCIKPEVYVKKNSETDINSLWWSVVWSWFIKNNTNFRGKWDFIWGICLQEHKSKALILPVNPESVHDCLKECLLTRMQKYRVWMGVEMGLVKAAVSTAVCLQECPLRKLLGHCFKECKLQYSEILHCNVPLWATLETERRFLIAENVDHAVCSSANWFYGAKIYIIQFMSGRGKMA